MAVQLLRLGVEVVELHVRTGEGSSVFGIVGLAGRLQPCPRPAGAAFGYGRRFPWCRVIVHRATFRSDAPVRMRHVSILPNSGDASLAWQANGSGRRPDGAKAVTRTPLRHDCLESEARVRATRAGLGRRGCAAGTGHARRSRGDDGGAEDGRLLARRRLELRVGYRRCGVRGPLHLDARAWLRAVGGGARLRPRLAALARGRRLARPAAGGDAARSRRRHLGRRRTGVEPDHAVRLRVMARY